MYCAKNSTSVSHLVFKTNNDINTITIPILQRRKVAIVVLQLFAENQTQVFFTPFHLLLNPTFCLILTVSQGLVNNRLLCSHRRVAENKTCNLDIIRFLYQTQLATGNSIEPTP